MDSRLLTERFGHPDAMHRLTDVGAHLSVDPTRGGDSATGQRAKGQGGDDDKGGKEQQHRGERQADGCQIADDEDDEQNPADQIHRERDYLGKGGTVRIDPAHDFAAGELVVEGEVTVQHRLNGILAHL